MHQVNSIDDAARKCKRMIEDRKEMKPTGCMHYEQLNGFGGELFS
jgi:hypothetical protein